MSRKFSKICRRILNLSANQNRTRSFQQHFSFDSGERQTGATLDKIRHDHKVRYDFAINYIKDNHLFNRKIFGLDIFCGSGYGTYMVASNLQCNMLGIDGSDEAVTFANRSYANSGTYYSYKMFPFTLPYGTFDFVVCYESLEHVENAILLMEQLNAGLKKNGFLFLSTPNERRFPFNKNFNKFHYKHYTMDEVMRLINDVGEYKLVTWLGQDLYELSDGKCMGNLPEIQMDLHESQEGQLMIYVLKKG